MDAAVRTVVRSAAGIDAGSRCGNDCSRPSHNRSRRRKQNRLCGRRAGDRLSSVVHLGIVHVHDGSPVRLRVEPGALLFCARLRRAASSFLLPRLRCRDPLVVCASDRSHARDGHSRVAAALPREGHAALAIVDDCRFGAPGSVHDPAGLSSRLALGRASGIRRALSDVAGVFIPTAAADRSGTQLLRLQRALQRALLPAACRAAGLLFSRQTRSGGLGPRCGGCHPCADSRAVAARARLAASVLRLAVLLRHRRRRCIHRHRPRPDRVEHEL